MVGLPVGVAGSAVLALLARLVLVPSYAEAGIAPGAFARLTLGWPW